MGGVSGNAKSAVIKTAGEIPDTQVRLLHHPLARLGIRPRPGAFLLPWWGGEVLRRQRLPVITLRVRARQQALARGVHPVFQAPRAAAVASAGCIESAALAVGPPASAGHVSSKVTSDNTSYAR